jgi:hypothetical protein
MLDRKNAKQIKNVEKKKKKKELQNVPRQISLKSFG